MQDLLNNPGGRLLSRGYKGQLADTAAHVIITRTNEGAAPIDFGVAVARGAEGDKCKAIAADADKVAGITVRHVTMPYDTDTGEVAYKKDATVPVLRFGRLFVQAKENAVEGDSVIAIVAEGGALGSTTGGAAGAGRMEVVGAKWADNVTAGDVGIIEVNLLGV